MPEKGHPVGEKLGVLFYDGGDFYCINCMNGFIVPEDEGAEYVLSGQEFERPLQCAECGTYAEGISIVGFNCMVCEQHYYHECDAIKPDVLMSQFPGEDFTFCEPCFRKVLNNEPGFEDFHFHRFHIRKWGNEDFTYSHFLSESEDFTLERAMDEVFIYSSGPVWDAMAQGPAPENWPSFWDTKYFLSPLSRQGSERAFVALYDIDTDTEKGPIQSFTITDDCFDVDASEEELSTLYYKSVDDDFLDTVHPNPKNHDQFVSWAKSVQERKRNAEKEKSE